MYSATVNDSGAVVATAFGPADQFALRLGPTRLTRDRRAVQTAREQLVAYFAGELRDFSLALAPVGTGFQHRVWTALRGIPYGSVQTYGQIAAQIGQAGAARAVGRANATNPLCVLIPCHRVIGADGSLTGFAFGEACKRRLLALEGARVPSRHG